jgi:hypothetical protein
LCTTATPTLLAAAALTSTALTAPIRAVRNKRSRSRFRMPPVEHSECLSGSSPRL